MKWIFLPIAIWLCGELYYLGGETGYNTKVRDLGVPTIITLWLWLGYGWSLWYLLHFGLLFGSLTTYWKKKGSDAKWWNWALHALGIGIAGYSLSIPFGWSYWYLWRTIILCVGITLWSEGIGNVKLEAGGRGGMIMLTIPLIFL